MAVSDQPTLADLRAPYEAYERWIGAQRVPIHRGYFIEDARTVELGWWEARGCEAAFLVLAGQEGVSESRLTGIPPGATLPPARFALDEIVYVVDGRGLTTIWAGDGPKTTFEWEKHSLFMLPRDHTYQLSNTQGNRSARLMHVNYLPSALNLRPDVSFFMDNAYVETGAREIFSEAKAVLPQNGTEAAAEGRLVWFGNFFPDLRAWDKLDNYQHRGAGGFHLSIQFPKSPMFSHMSVFPARTYKKGHRHGPGVVIVIPAGEGYSVMWANEDAEKVVIPWHEASVFVPPNRWFHQHFNLGGEPARYLAFHAPRVGVGMDEAERIQNRANDQIEYPNEDHWIRQKFEDELSKRGLTSLMPDGAYRSHDYKWAYEENN